MLCPLLVVQAQVNRVYYYYAQEKVYLDIIDNMKLLCFNNTIESSEIDLIHNQLRALNLQISPISPFMNIIRGNTSSFDEDAVILDAINKCMIQMVYSFFIKL